MESIERTITFSILDPEELSEDEKELLFAAYEARQKAQAPYSEYMVGAAIRVWNGNEIFTGCNVERASYTQTTHAEQAAIDAAVGKYGPKTKLKKIAIVSAPEGVEIPISFAEDLEWTIQFAHPFDPINQPIVPCGHCMQIIWENCQGDDSIELLAIHQSGSITKTTIGNAFPWKFGPEDIKK